MKCTFYSYGSEIGFENNVVDYDYDDGGNGIMQINVNQFQKRQGKGLNEYTGNLKYDT